jgi:hypothetical protein
MKYCPLNISESEDPLMHKKWFHHDNNFSVKIFCNVLLAACTEVEKEIVTEMKELKYVSIMHNGWTKFGTHNLGLLAYFCKHNGSGEYSSTFHLLSVSPIHALSGLDEEEDNIEEATNINAQTTADHITEFLESFYDIPVVSNWTVCQTADNASVNKRSAQILGVPHIACYNHLLDKEVKQMIDESKNVPCGRGSVCNKEHDT